MVSNWLPIKKSYAQHGEDEYFFEALKAYNINPAKDIYVDVGANHPVSISNTYLFYRNGYRGVVIEPNLELIKLFQLFRPKDIALAIGCGNKCSLERFRISKTPVLSSFSNTVEVNEYKEYYSPILPLDNVLQRMEFENIFLLSIDVEGLNWEVLEGSVETLHKSLFVVVEFEDAATGLRIKEMMTSLNFSFIRDFGDCNYSFLNNTLHEKLLRTRPSV